MQHKDFQVKLVGSGLSQLPIIQVNRQVYLLIDFSFTLQLGSCGQQDIGQCCVKWSFRTMRHSFVPIIKPSSRQFYIYFLSTSSEHHIHTVNCMDDLPGSIIFQRHKDYVSNYIVLISLIYYVLTWYWKSDGWPVNLCSAPVHVESPLFTSLLSMTLGTYRVTISCLSNKWKLGKGGEMLFSTICALVFS